MITTRTGARAVILLTFLLAVLAASRGARAQIYTPQSSSGLSVSFQSERMGGSRVLIFGDVRNTTGSTYERVVLLAEGLDETGKVVSRGRAYVTGTVPPKGSSSFELRLLASGSERRYRVQIESFQQIEN